MKVCCRNPLPNGLEILKSSLSADVCKLGWCALAFDMSSSINQRASSKWTAHALPSMFKRNAVNGLLTLLYLRSPLGSREMLCNRPNKHLKARKSGRPDFPQHSLDKLSAPAALSKFALELQWLLGKWNRLHSADAGPLLLRDIRVVRGAMITSHLGKHCLADGLPQSVRDA